MVGMARWIEINSVPVVSVVDVAPYYRLHAWSCCLNWTNPLVRRERRSSQNPHTLVM
jgi:hypothetical protein